MCAHLHKRTRCCALMRPREGLSTAGCPTTSMQRTLPPSTSARARDARAAHIRHRIPICCHAGPHVMKPSHNPFPARTSLKSSYPPLCLPLSSHVEASPCPRCSRSKRLRRTRAGAAQACITRCRVSGSIDGNPLAHVEPRATQCAMASQCPTAFVEPSAAQCPPRYRGTEVVEVPRCKPRNCSMPTKAWGFNTHRGRCRLSTMVPRPLPIRCWAQCPSAQGTVCTKGSEYQSLHGLHTRLRGAILASLPLLTLAEAAPTSRPRFERVVVSLTHGCSGVQVHLGTGAGAPAHGASVPRAWGVGVDKEAVASYRYRYIAISLYR